MNRHVARLLDIVTSRVEKTFGAPEAQLVTPDFTTTVAPLLNAVHEAGDAVLRPISPGSHVIGEKKTVFEANEGFSSTPLDVVAEPGLGDTALKILNDSLRHNRARLLEAPAVIVHMRYRNPTITYDLSTIEKAGKYSLNIGDIARAPIEDISEIEQWIRKQRPYLVGRTWKSLTTTMQDRLLHCSLFPIEFKDKAYLDTLEDHEFTLLISDDCLRLLS